MDPSDITTFVQEYDDKLKSAGYQILSFAPHIIHDDFPFVSPLETALVQVGSLRNSSEFPPFVDAECIERVLPQIYKGSTLILQYLSFPFEGKGQRIATKPKPLGPLYPSGVITCDDDRSYNGQEIYEILIRKHPEILEKYGGEDIWIDPSTRFFVIGAGIGAARKLEQKSGKDSGKGFYSRGIGYLARV